MLATLAPLVLGSLGKARQQSGMGAKDLSNMLQGENSAMEKQNSALGGLLSGMLDQDGDGSILDDIAGRLFGRN